MSTSLPDLLKLMLEDDSSEDGGTRTATSMDKKIRAMKTKILRMMKDGKDLKEVMGLLDKAVEEMDKEIDQVQVMASVADIAVKFQNGIDISAPGKGYNVKDNRKGGRSAAAAKADDSKSEEGPSVSPAANPTEQPNPASSSPGEIKLAPEAPVKVPVVPSVKLVPYEVETEEEKDNGK